ncbi:MAG: diaminopimelate epimerase [Rickettsia endosymbiont of Bryobia graminum]|nr:diaminopimelate epimerase [Rickettsia endosymbiont of Bryobia graminum]
MTQKIYFVKMHGLGNDFVIINKDDLPISYDLPKLAINISNRHIGIGCDQFIIYQQKADHYEMLVYNQDGSRAKLCGNASRCLAKLIYLNTGKKETILNIQGKRLTCKILDENEISIDTGIVSFEKDWMPSSDKIWQLAERYMIDLKEAICADIGNPHFVIFSDLSDQDKEIIGEKLQEKELFIDGVNVNFASIKNNKIYLSVWERGAGLTLACGSGACATFASALKLGFVSSPCEVVFKLGSLKMSKQGENIIMTGPATIVARGEFLYE